MEDAADLLARWRQGDQQAAAGLFQRYAERLIGLARDHLTQRLSHRFDPEDVVQSVYRSFFNGTRAGRYDIERGSDIWQLLVAITFHKLYVKVRGHKAQRRSIEREAGLTPDVMEVVASQEPSPFEAVALVDQVEEVMRRLPPLSRAMLELRLQGFQLQEISAATKRSVSTVRRALTDIKQTFKQLASDAVCDSVPPAGPSSQQADAPGHRSGGEIGDPVR